ncbi:MAG: hypothetical protein V4708_17575 [Bacteroidota bacterium]
MTESLLHFGKKTSLPYSSLLRDKFASAVTSRNQRAFSPSGTEYSGNQVIEIPISVNSWADFQRSYLSITFAGGDGLKGVAIAKSAHSIFRKLAARTSTGKLLGELENADLLSAVLQNYTLSDNETNSAFNITSLAHRVGFTLEADKYACIQLPLAFLKIEQLVPMHLTGGINLTLTLQSTSKCTISNRTGFGNPVIKDVKFFLECCTLSPEAELQFLNEYENEGLKYHMHQYESVVIPMRGTNSGTIDRLQIKNQANSLLGVLVVPRYVSDINAGDRNPYRSPNLVNRISIRLGTEAYEDMTTPAEMFINLQDFFDMSNNSNSEVINHHTYFGRANDGETILVPQTNPHVYHQPWAPYGKLTSAGEPEFFYDSNDSNFVFAKSFSVVKSDESVLSGNTSRGDITIDIHRGATDDSDLEYTVFTLFESELTISRKRGIEVIY